MLKYYWLPLVFIISSLGLPAQNCPPSFSIGNDTTLCEGTSLLLVPDVVINDPLEVTWSPLTDLTTTPGNQEATVEPTVPTTYTLSVRSIVGPQLVSNGDFSQGNTGFTSDYDLWTSSGNLDEGNYRVTTNPQNVHGDFASCSDNSPGTGNMLVVNASSDPDDIWCQNITVTAGATYAFSVALTTVVATNPAELQFRINGQLLGSSFNAPPTNCNWLEFFELWDSGSTTSAEICINNQNTASTGNDFAIDDISFQLTCLNEASITVTPADPPTAEFTAPPALCSSSAPIDPISLLTTDATPGGVFLVDNIPVASSIDPALLSEGVHELLYRVGVPGCMDEQMATFTIETGRSAGVFADGLVDELTFCDVPAGLFATYLESGFTGDPSGTFFLSGGSSVAFIDQATGGIDFIDPPLGTFTVFYRFGATTACPADESQIQLTFNPSPTFDLSNDVVLDCNQPNVTLSNAAAALPGFTYTWLRDGSFFSADESIFVDTPGTYELSATNSLTDCSGSATVTVSGSVDAIAVDVGNDVILDCSQPTTTLSNSTTALPEFNYTWTLDGVLFSTEENISTDLTGNYELTITNELTGCSGSDNVNVSRGTDLISIDLEVNNPSCGPANLLTGGSAAIPTVLNGTPPYLYSINGGTFGPDSLFTDLGAGQYTISVEAAGGCTVDTTFELIDPSNFIFNFTVEDNERIEFGTSLPVSVQTDLPARYQDSITWFPTNIAHQGSTRIVAIADSNLFYLASVVTDEGCVFSDSLRLSPFAPQLIYAPNAFSPNGDGVNDNWTVFSHPAVTAIRTALIYDRWGNAIFVADDITGNNPEIGWDGTRNGKPLPVGSYLWTVEVELFDGSKERFSGEIVLIR